MASSHRDYIPQNAAQFSVFVKNIIQYIEKKTGTTTPEWTNIPQGRVAMLQDSALLFDQAFTAEQAAPTHANRADKEESYTEIPMQVPTESAVVIM